MFVLSCQLSSGRDKRPNRLPFFYKETLTNCVHCQSFDWRLSQLTDAIPPILKDDNIRIVGV